MAKDSLDGRSGSTGGEVFAKTEAAKLGILNGDGVKSRPDRSLALEDVLDLSSITKNW